eukprot:ANDGO_07201.mRNA.1 hypothetical protein
MRDGDPILSLLDSYTATGVIAGFHFTTNVKGAVWELAFVWHILRLCIIRQKARCTLTLHTLFSPLCAANSVLSDALHQWEVMADEGLDASSLVASRNDDDDDDDEQLALFHSLLACRATATRRVMYNVDKDAGADVLFLATKIDNRQERILVSVPCKAGKRSSLRECLRSSSLAWQLTTEPQRAAGLSGVTVLL